VLRILRNSSASSPLDTLIQSISVFLGSEGSSFRLP
jgi:hypothetical protein